MHDYQSSVSAVLQMLSTSESGLSSSDARTRREKWGENKLREAKRVSLFRRIFQQLTDPMVLVLLGSAAFSAMLGGEEARADVWIILAVVVLNTLLGVIQESRAEAALRALRDMAPAVCHVLRDRRVKQIPSSELVPGDVVVLEAGDAVPADGRLIEVGSLRVEESALTGEAVPVEKNTDAISGDVPPAERKCMAYMGSCAVYGRGKMVVTRTGMATEMGKIASSLEGGSSRTPLQKKLNQLSGMLTVLVLIVCAITFLLGWWKEGKWTLDSALRSFLLAVSLAVAAIPEGLVAVVTIVLSMGVSRMARRRAIVRKLTAVETLGCTGVICSDKTGTLTQNRMTAVASFGEKKKLATAMALCNNAAWNGEMGDPTEAALLSFAREQGIAEEKLKEEYPRIGEIPFDSERKRMTTYHRLSDGSIIQFTKGAPDVVMARCTAQMLPNGGVRVLSASSREQLAEKNREYAASALRVMAAAYRMPARVPDQPNGDAEERDLILLGFVGMQDPIRPEAPGAIATCRSAGIRVVMITGDHPDTARAIAHDLGMPHGDRDILTGVQLNQMDDDALCEAVKDCSVFARVQPEHKTRIVDAWRRNGVVTAMTGDGVNDAPAMRHSDIGVGMGLCGTDVTKGCADLILADDNFATIVCAVEEGRRIWDNICKAIHFLLSSNLSEVITVFAATLYGVTILQPIHLLFINLITDSLPALALGMEKAEENVMERQPRSPKEGIFSGGVLRDIVSQGSAAALLTGASFVIGGWLERGGGSLQQTLSYLASVGSVTGRTMAFLTMAMAETFHALNMRSHTESLFRMKTKNPLLSAAILLSVLLCGALIYFPPLTALFRFEQIPFVSFLIALGLAALMLPFGECRKLGKRRRHRNGKR